MTGEQATSPKVTDVLLLRDMAAGRVTRTAGGITFRRRAGALQPVRVSKGDLDRVVDHNGWAHLDDRGVYGLTDAGEAVVAASQREVATRHA